MKHKAIGLILAGSMVFFSQAARAQSAQSPENKTAAPERRDFLLKQDLPPMDGAQLKLSALELKCAPDCTTPPHVHSGPVFVYVLEGAILSQVQSQPHPVEVSQGEWFYEPPLQPHLVAKNSSPTNTARALIFFLTENGKPLTTMMK